MESKEEKIRRIKKEINELKNFPLVEFRKKNKYKPVIGEGSLDAKVMFVGEAPGENEAREGRPFIGMAGEELDELLGNIGIKREEIYITSVLKDRPPKNREPKPEEIDLYLPFLTGQIKIIKPEIIVALGRIAFKAVFDIFNIKSSDSVSGLHGETFETRADYGKIKIFVSYHPAAGLYRNELREVIRKDFDKLGKMI